MTLGDLEFTAEDFGVEHYAGAFPPEQISDIVAQRANYLLRERLRNAPEVQAVGESKRNWWDVSKRWPFGAKPTHTARLVCAEKMK